MNYATVCSGIGAPEAAWEPMGWHCVFQSEIEPFPCAALKHHYPNVPNYGDMTNWRNWPVHKLDVLCAGTPCQAFSVAGLRNSLDDDRGNLTLEFARYADHVRPRYVLWENVPGVLSTKDNAFGCLLGALAGSNTALLPNGKRWTNAGLVSGPIRQVAWRILDAQYFGVPQRRRRVFVLACDIERGAGDWACARALFPQRESMRGDSAPCRETRKEVAGTLGGGSGNRGWSDDLDRCGAFVAKTVTTGEGARLDMETCTFIAHTLRGTGHDASEDGTGRGVPLVFDPQSGGDCRGLDPKPTAQIQRCQIPAVVYDMRENGEDGTGRGTPLVFDTAQITSAANYSNPKPGDPCPPLNTVAQMHVATYDMRGNGDGVPFHALCGDHAGRPTDYTPVVTHRSTVRRLSPRECERLQGFPDDYTLIQYRGKPAADGPRYKAIGNSMAVPVLAWLGRRIKAVDALGARKEN